MKQGLSILIGNIASLRDIWKSLFQEEINAQPYGDLRLKSLTLGDDRRRNWEEQKENMSIRCEMEEHDKGIVYGGSG